ncbi:MAG: phasin family protein [Alphaproteobacteria bacterium]|nr:phasin family protein [Alphaproteobacteria bacterium]
MATTRTKKTAAKAKAAPKAAAKAADHSFFAQAREALEERVGTLNDRAKEAWETMQNRAKTAREGAEDAIGVVRTSLEAAGAGVRDVNLKVIEFVQADANAYFDAMRKVAAAKSIKEALEIQGGYVRAQFQTSVQNIRAVRDVAAEAAREAFEPVREGFAKLRKAA